MEVEAIAISMGKFLGNHLKVAKKSKLQFNILD
jgi:hypothetical protein